MGLKGFKLEDFPPEMLAQAKIVGVNHAMLNPVGISPAHIDETRFEFEKKFMEWVIAEAHLRGWLVYHTFDSRKSVAGFPDLVMIRGNRVLAAELKVKHNKPTAEQQKWLKAFSQAGIPSYCWWPSDCEEIQRLLG